MLRVGARRSTGAAVRDDPRTLAPPGKRRIVLVAADPQAPERIQAARHGSFATTQNGSRARRSGDDLRLAPEAEDREKIEQRLGGLRKYQAGLN